MSVRHWSSTLAIVVACGSAGAQTPASPPATASPPVTGTRTIRLIVPFAPGGAQDVIGRFLGAKLASRLDATVVIENKAGAGGVIAAETVAKAAPDGNTLLLATGGAISITPHLNPKLPYSAERDFAPVAMVADTPMTLSVRTQSAYRSVADVLADAKARPGEVTYASTGNGTVSHLTGELLAQTAGVKLLHVPYRGAAPALTDLLGGQVALIVTSAASISPMVDDGKARVLGTFTQAPIPSLHGAPTVTEASGLKGMQVPVWVGVMAPVNTPAPIIDRLAEALLAICQQPETKERMNSLGAVTTCGGPKAFGQVVGDDISRWGAVIRQGNIKAE